jgi:hypothetical protein
MQPENGFVPKPCLPEPPRRQNIAAFYKAELAFQASEKRETCESDKVIANFQKKSWGKGPWTQH